MSHTQAGAKATVTAKPLDALLVVVKLKRAVQLACHAGIMICRCCAVASIHQPVPVWPFSYGIYICYVRESLDSLLMDPEQ